MELGEAELLGGNQNASVGKATHTITAFSAVIYMAYGVDFPRLNARLSRLV